MMKPGMEMRVAQPQRPYQKTYTQQQIAQLIGLKDHTVRWLKHERQNLEMKGAELRDRLAKINRALTLIQQLSNERKDLAVFEMMRL